MVNPTEGLILEQVSGKENVVFSSSGRRLYSVDKIEPRLGRQLVYFRIIETTAGGEFRGGSVSLYDPWDMFVVKASTVTREQFEAMWSLSGLDSIFDRPGD